MAAAITNCPKGVLTHSVIVLAQPVYLVIRQLLNSKYLSGLPTSWLAIIKITWVYIITRITVPFLRSPLHYIPSPPTDRFGLGHFNPHGELFPIKNLEKMFRTPNDGVIAVWGLLYLKGEILPTRPDACVEMMNARNYDWEKPVPAKRLLSRILGNGLINVEGNEHKAMRKVVAPAFSGRHIRDLVPLFYGKGIAFAESLARESRNASNGVLEMMTHMSHVTLDIIGAAGVGMDFNTIENDDDPLAHLYETIMDPNRGSIFIFFLITAFVPPWIVRRMGNTIYARVAKAGIQLREDVRLLMQEKKQRMTQKANREQAKDIIAIIMESGNFSDDYLVDQLMTFLAAGHETTASAMTWTLWLLSLHPEIQDRLRNECNAKLAEKHASNIDAAVFDAETMPYLTAVCNETLRLYPTVPATARYAVKPTRIGKYQIPQGTPAIVIAWSINRDTDVWGPDANIYNPDRWLGGENATYGGATSPYGLLTFIYGPRSCIGQSFARMEMKCLLATMIMRFRFELANPNEKVEVGGFITIKPQNGLRLKLHDLRAQGNGA